MRIALFEPEIHWNTGNIGRTCVATGTELHLIGRLGFSLDEREIRRSGLDYWPKLSLRLHADWEGFVSALEPEAPLLFFSTKGRQTLWEAPFRPDSVLVFGSESRGLPDRFHRRFAESFYRIPMNEDVRSLNLSTAAGIVLYEALRKTSGAALAA